LSQPVSVADKLISPPVDTRWSFDGISRKATAQPGLSHVALTLPQKCTLGALNLPNRLLTSALIFRENAQSNCYPSYSLRHLYIEAPLAHDFSKPPFTRKNKFFALV
jgi:hypothetical protein